MLYFDQQQALITGMGTMDRSAGDVQRAACFGVAPGVVAEQGSLPFSNRPVFTAMGVALQAQPLPRVEPQPFELVSRAFKQILIPAPRADHPFVGLAHHNPAGFQAWRGWRLLARASGLSLEE